MKVVLLIPALGLHQLPLAEAFYKLLNHDFCVVVVDKITSGRFGLNYDMLADKYDYVIKSYENDEKQKKAGEVILSSDAVIAGGVPNKYLKARLKKQKLVFRYSERIYRNWKKLLTLPLRFLKYHLYNYGSKNVFLLCAGAYAAKDYNLTFNYLNKCYKWGYFPKRVIYPDYQKLFDDKENATITWAARFVRLKHPEVVISIAKQLKEQGYSFKINMIGDGEEFENIKKLIHSNDLGQYICLRGALSSSEVRTYMEKSKIFLFTSDKNEGWGAVVNEAMNSACVVVGCKSIGAIPYLIQDGYNGFSYKYKDYDGLLKTIKFLLDNQTECKRIGINAYLTIVNMWNAQSAAERLIETAKKLVQNKEINFYDEGVCSRA